MQGSPAAPTRTTRTPAFYQIQQQGNKLQREDYPEAYEKDRRAQFLKSMTKGPKMEFPGFDGANPGGWIRQAEKYFQMAGAPPEYKVSLAQMYFVGRADVWLRRAGILKKQYT